MARRMVSLTDSQPQVSATLSRAGSVPIIRPYCLRSPHKDLEDPAIDPVELGAKSARPMLPLAGGFKSSVGHSYRRHDTYFFEDGNIMFSVRGAPRYCMRPVRWYMLQVNGTLYYIHRYFFARDSVYFSTKFTQLGVRGHEPLRIIGRC